MFTNVITEKTKDGKANLDKRYGQSSKHGTGVSRFSLAVLRDTASDEIAKIKTEKDRDNVLKDLARLENAARTASKTGKGAFIVAAGHAALSLSFLAFPPVAALNVAAAAANVAAGVQQKKNAKNLPEYLKTIESIRARVKKMKLPVSESMIEERIVLALRYKLEEQKALNEMLMLEVEVGNDIQSEVVNENIDIIEELNTSFNESIEAFAVAQEERFNNFLDKL